MDQEHQIISWLKGDEMRMKALRIAASLNLKDWCIGAGFVRNLVWDKLHNHAATTPLNDIDLIYFDRAKVAEEIDLSIENTLRKNSAFPWSVKNQARMHLRNRDEPYLSTSHSMSHWVELETAIGAKLNNHGCVELVAPFGLEVLFSNTVTINPDRAKPADFKQRVESKRWLELWPNLKISKKLGSDSNFQSAISLDQ